MLLAAEDACPSRAGVAAALRGILPGTRIAVESEGGTVPRVTVTDGGASFRVVVDGVERQFKDEGGRCRERARKAAVFIALTIDPPAVPVVEQERSANAVSPPPGAPAEAPAPVPAATAAAVSGAAPRRSPWLAVQLEFGGIFSAAPRNASNSLYSGGGAVRLYVGGRRLGGVLGVAVLSPTVLDLSGDRARLTRVPIDAAVRGRLRRDRIVGALDLGVLMTVQVSQGLDVQPARQEARLEVGLRAAARIEYWFWRRIGGFLSVDGEYVPLPSDFVLPDRATIGTAPSLWLGGTVGLVADLR